MILLTLLVSVLSGSRAYQWRRENSVSIAMKDSNFARTIFLGTPFEDTAQLVGCSHPSLDSFDRFDGALP